MKPHNYNDLTTKVLRPILLAAVVIFLLLAPVSVFAKSLADYQKSVRVARDSVDELSGFSSDSEEKNSASNDEYERELIALIRENLPASEKIEWEGSTVETDNRWLTDKLDAFEKEKNPSKRAEILNIIGERLSGLQEKIAELETASAASRTKDEDKQKLAEILRRADYQKTEPNTEESLLQKWYRQLMDWLARVFPRPNLPDTAPTGFQSFSVVLQVLLYALVAGAIGFTVYKFAPLVFGKYRARDKPEKKERVILGERIAANESAANLFNEAETLAREGNLRAAIRKGYIAVLCDLSDKKIISAARHKTNRDYLRDISKQRELYKNMNDLTNNFERHWYGFKSATEEDWNEFRQEYKRII